MNNSEKLFLAIKLDYTNAGLDDPILECLSDNYFSNHQTPVNTGTLETRPKATNLEFQSFLNSDYADKKTGSRPIKKNSFDQLVQVDELAKRADNVGSLIAELKAYKQFFSLKGSQGLVLPSGNPSSKVVIISEQPGRLEEIANSPYTGEEKKLFDNILSSIGLTFGQNKETDVYVVPCLPFRLVRSNGKPYSDIDLIRPFLFRLLDLLAPRYIISIGKMSGVVLNYSVTLKRREEKDTIDFYNKIPVFEIAGINEMIRYPEKKRQAWNRLKLLRKIMEQNSG